MEYLTLARIIHVVAIIIWIGGVAMVTMVIIPAIQRMKSKEEQIETFETIEGRFAGIAKVATVLAALTGFYMLYALQGWNRLLMPEYWWIHGMILVWLAFTVVLFILEPLVLHRLFREYAAKNPARTFVIMHRFHWILLLLSILVTIGAVAGSHGLFFI